MAGIFGLASSSMLLAAVAAYVVYLFGLVVYRLYFHPLAKYPGPRFAAISRWHEFYYDVVQPGQFMFVIDKWHDQYGPILRIVPDEVHIRDSQFYDTIYSKGGRADKYAWNEPRFSAPGASFSTPSSELHNTRRKALNPLFSRGRIIQLEEVIQKKVDMLIGHIRNYRKTGKPFSLERGYMALTGDIIMRYCFGLDYDHLNSKDFETTFHEPFLAASKNGAMASHFPLVPKIMNSLPEAWVEKIEPIYAMFFKLKRDLMNQIIALKNKQELDIDKSVTTVFQSLLDNTELPIDQKENARLSDEAQVVVAGGITTTGWCLSVGSFHIVNTPEIYAKLRKELEAAIPDPNQVPKWAELEALPYLSACIREAVRISDPITMRSQRLFNKPIVYKDWVIPARTPVSLTIIDVCKDEEIFPDHKVFNPDRWMNGPKTKDGSSLERYFVSFQKGTRSCLGINLAYCEMYLAMAQVFRNFKFELYETKASDVQVVHDFGVGFSSLASKGVRVKCLPDQ